MAKRTKYIELYEDKAGKWRWRKLAANGKKVGSSGEAFATYENAALAAQTEARGTTVEVRRAR